MVWVARCALGAVLVLAAVGCPIERTATSVGQGCGTNGDCAVGELCTYDRCHALCIVSGDCTPTVCAALRGAAVCLLADEQICPCPDGLDCGPDGTCHVVCEAARDCTSEQSCTEGLCLEPAAEEEEPDAGADEDATEELEEFDAAVDDDVTEEAGEEADAGEDASDE